jgi:AcrR family transcriptional regulator
MTASAQPRWRRRKDARPAEIIEAALACFAARGFAATRLDDIARRAGITRGTLYLYFPNKEELFKAVVRQAIGPVLARTATMIASSQAPSAEILRQVIRAIPDGVIQGAGSAIPKLVITEAANFPDLARFYLDEVVHPAKKQIGDLIRRGIARGEFREIDADQAVYCVIAPVLLAALWRHSLQPFDAEGLDYEALMRSHAELLLHGLARTGGAS